MAMAVEDQGTHDLGFLWENQSWGGLSNSDDNSNDETKDKLEVIKESNEGGGGESLVNKNKKRSRAIRNKGKKVLMKNDAGEEGNSKDHGGKCREADHDLHIWTERERRKKMRNMFASLHALLPQLPSKADKSTIVDEAVSYIKSLQKTVDKLEKLKREKDQAVSPIGCESSVINSHWNPFVDSSSRDAFIGDKASSNNNLAGGALGRVVSNPSISFSSSAPLRQQVAFKTFASPNLVLTMFGNEAQYSICATRKQGLFTTIAFVLEKHRLDVISASILCNRNANRYMILAHANKALPQFQDATSVEQTFRRAGGEIIMWLS